MSEPVKVRRSSGNVFADLDIPEPEEYLEKADLAIRIYQIIRERKLTQRQAAKILGIDQPKVSALINGNLDGFSIHRLYRFLNALDQDVEVIIKPKQREKARVEVRVVAA